MRIKMVETTSGSYDGIHIRTYDKDQEFEVGDGYMPADLARAFVDSGAAKELGTPAKKGTPPGPSETKEDEKKPDEKKK